MLRLLRVCTLVLVAGLPTMPPVFAQAPSATGSGRAPVPNVRSPLPQVDTTPAPVTATPSLPSGGTPKKAAPLEGERPANAMAAVGRVVDGDTLRLDGRTYRLWGIDAPELIQVCYRGGQGYACGREAAAYLRMLLSAESVPGDGTPAGEPAQLVCEPRASDQYGRTAAQCRLGDKDLAAEMVRAGWALMFARHGTDYAPEEDEAREARRGLWAGTFEMPWDWRARRSGE